MKHLRTGAALLALAALLVACGGGSTEGDAPRAPNEVPSSALASPEAYTAFAASLKDSDTDAPMGLDTVKSAPSSDTALPVGT